MAVPPSGLDMYITIYYIHLYVYIYIHIHIYIYNTCIHHFVGCIHHTSGFRFLTWFLSHSRCFSRPDWMTPSPGGCYARQRHWRPGIQHGDLEWGLDVRCGIQNSTPKLRGLWNLWLVLTIFVQDMGVWVKPMIYCTRMNGGNIQLCMTYFDVNISVFRFCFRAKPSLEITLLALFQVGRRAATKYFRWVVIRWWLMRERRGQQDFAEAFWLKTSASMIIFFLRFGMSW